VHTGRSVSRCCTSHGVVVARAWRCACVAGAADGSDKHPNVQLTLPRTVIGRGAASDVVLDMNVVSKEHCIISRSPSGHSAFLEDSRCVRVWLVQPPLAAVALTAAAAVVCVAWRPVATAHL
jgi:hypothetical protein